MKEPPIHFNTPAGMRDWCESQHAQKRRIVLVPTMGALHDGHLSLLDIAQQHGDLVIVSIYINPTQFSPDEDYKKYPRQLEQDLGVLHQRGVDAVFVPTNAVMYPAGYDTLVVPHELAKTLCGKSRPQHFRGVSTVVMMLMQITACDAMVLGEKDFQQLQIIRQMVKDLWLKTEIIAAPIVRDPDGLAMSSRNARLTPRQRQEAAQLHVGLERVQSRFADGVLEAQALLMELLMALRQAPSGTPDYAEIVSQAALQPMTEINEPAICAIAVNFDKVRLIDNCLLG